MSAIEEYFNHQSQKLQIDFNLIRSVQNDSDVKGGNNEQIVMEFLKNHVMAHYYVKGVEIIDSTGERSDEIDVCACNIDQPFGESPSQLIIAEGVDYVVQVKAQLSPHEIRRSIKNCESIKKLKRKNSIHDLTFAHKEDIPYFVDRIPYIVFAFSASASLETTHRNIINESNTTPLHLQPDAFFILGEGNIINFREGKGKTWTSGGKPIIGYCAAYSGEQILLEFIKYITEYVPRFRRFISPLTHYFTPKPQYRFVGQIAKNTDEGNT